MARAGGGGGAGNQAAIRYSGGKLYWADVIAATGDTPVIACPAGKRIRVVYITFTPDSDATTSNMVKVRFEGDANNLYCGYAAGHWEVFDGQNDMDLIFNLENSGPIAATVHYEILKGTV